MTIQELYDWAKENNVLDYDLYINLIHGDFGIVDIDDIEINKTFREIRVTDY